MEVIEIQVPKVSELNQSDIADMIGISVDTLNNYIRQRGDVVRLSNKSKAAKSQEQLACDMNMSVSTLQNFKFLEVVRFNFRPSFRLQLRSTVSESMFNIRSATRRWLLTLS